MRHSEHKRMTCDKARRLVDLCILADPWLSAGNRSLAATALLTDGQVTSAWDEKAPDLQTILETTARAAKLPNESFCMDRLLTHSILKGGKERINDRILGLSVKRDIRRKILLPELSVTLLT